MILLIVLKKLQIRQFLVLELHKLPKKCSTRPINGFCPEINVIFRMRCIYQTTVPCVG